MPILKQCSRFDSGVQESGRRFLHIFQNFLRLLGLVAHFKGLLTLFRTLQVGENARPDTKIPLASAGQKRGEDGNAGQRPDPAQGFDMTPCPPPIPGEPPP